MTASRNRKVSLGPLSPSPSVSTEEATLVDRGGEVELRCVYERDGGLRTGGLRFSWVRAYRFRAESHCTSWHVQDAYDVLVEVEASDWIAELRAAEPSGATWDRPIRHFLIFVDSAGASEAAAESVEWMAEESVIR